jgi:sugar-specific transcriptional regulator TrmB
MNDSELLEQLVQLVMSERQAKVYLSMLRNGACTAAELQRKAGIPHSKIYDTLEFLVSQGYCVKRQAGKKRTYVTIDPTVAMRRNITRLESRIEELKELAERLAAVQVGAGKTKDPFEYIEVLHGNENIHNKYNQLQNAAQFEMLGFTRPPFAYFTPEMQKEQFIATEKFLEGGGIGKSIIEANDESPARIFKTIEQGMRMVQEVDTSHKSEIRVVSKLPIKMFIFDRETLLITEKSSAIEEAELSMTVVKQKSMVEGYIALFNFFWDQGLDCKEWIAKNKELFEKKLAELANS